MNYELDEMRELCREIALNMDLRFEDMGSYSKTTQSALLSALSYALNQKGLPFPDVSFVIFGQRYHEHHCNRAHLRFLRYSQGIKAVKAVLCA